jgi:hypothetical protein
VVSTGAAGLLYQSGFMLVMRTVMAWCIVSSRGAYPTVRSPGIVVAQDLNRSMGPGDVYPFVLSPAVHDKLHFVRDVIGRAGAQGSSSWLGWLRYRRAHTPMSLTVAPRQL